MKIATLGPEGTFSHQAALTYGEATYVFAHSIEGVFDILKQGLVDTALLPLENSVSGTVLPTLDQLLDCDYLIQSEILLPIAHHLVSFLDLDQIQKIYTHPHTHEQCRRSLERLFTLDARFEGTEIVYTTSNAISAEVLMQDKECGAALLPEYVAKLHGTPFLKENMQDVANNQTRFILLGKTTTNSTGKDRTSMIFLPGKNRRGLLSDILMVFTKYHLNLTKIESRPARKKLGEYLFYVDLEGHMEDKAVQKALEEVQSISSYRFLGSYPRLF